MSATQAPGDDYIDLVAGKQAEHVLRYVGDATDISALRMKTTCLAGPISSPVAKATVT